MATIAEEQAANARARAEGYESAAHKEMHANAGAQAAGHANAVQQEIDANRRAQAAGFANAAEKEMDANRRSVEAGFTSAVDQEIDANRRAREAGYLNAADYESGLRTRSDDPFQDPRLQPAPVIPEQFRLGTANFPQYNTAPTAPRMPASGLLGAPTPGGIWGPPIQAGGGYGQFGEYLVPPQYTGPASTDPYVMQSSMGPGWDYQYPINPNGMIRGFGGGGPGGGGYPGGGGGGILGPIGPGTGAAAGGTKYPGVRTGSQKEQDLDAGRTHHPEMYDINDAWVGSEGGGALEAGVAIDRTTGVPYGQPSYGSTSGGANLIARKGATNYGPQFGNFLSNVASGSLLTSVPQLFSGLGFKSPAYSFGALDPADPDQKAALLAAAEAESGAVEHEASRESDIGFGPRG